MKLLLIEDDQPTAVKGVAPGQTRGQLFARQAEGLLLATTVTYDAAVIDRMPPGLALCCPTAAGC
jgi:hypothetical protein